MWECRNCQEKIEDRYKHCWNCGTAKPDAGQNAPPVRIHLKEPPSPATETPSEIAPAAEFPPKDELPPKETAQPENEAPPKTSAPSEVGFSFGNAIPLEERSSSKIGGFALLVLWLAATVGVGSFAYYSNQKTKDFENRLREQAAGLTSAAKQFVFSKDAPREKKGTIKAKVLPLNATNAEVDGLYFNLPDDLRPATIDEVKTILWLDCKPGDAGLYEDGTPAFRDKCNAYLVDRASSKVVQVQDFSGELPPLKKQWGTSYASGKVLSESYISYIKANQPEAERAPFARASDSPDHHIWFKSEMLYATALLILLASADIGWIIYKIKSAL